jgi:hypothetical protein
MILDQLERRLFMGDKEPVERAIRDKENAEHEIKGQSEPHTGQDRDRGDLRNPAGNPKVDTEHTKPIGGTEREGRNEPGHAPEQPGGGRGGGGEPTHQAPTPTQKSGAGGNGPKHG